MGAGASIPDKLDLAAAKELAGDAFDEAKYFRTNNASPTLCQHQPPAFDA
jgi:hypothetical protein